MENHIYRLEASGRGHDNATIEFSIFDTNELNPVRDIKELGLVVLGKDLQIDASLNEDELDSLIDYLQDCQRYIQKFNAKE